MNAASPDTRGGGWLAWLIVVLAWLVCAAFCLALTVALEPWPGAYDTLYPVAIVVLFANIFVFWFILNRWSGDPRRLTGSAVRVCLGEGLFLALIYCLGRFALG